MDQRLMEIADRLLMIAQSMPQDVDCQGHFADEEELVSDLQDHAERLRRGDVSRLPELKFLLLPTGSFNEIALSNGWGDIYVTLANRFDEVYTGPWALPREPDLHSADR
ncbi:hypothetical protein [Streptomyces sp. NPDC001165]|uniref:hypothetical protein n=1 Tax=Streptomyces sp. NPDC001165 TaxID=3364546 RepID=UPI00369089AD